MADLTADTPLEWEVFPGQVDEVFKVQSGQTIFVGQGVAFGTAEEEVRDLVNGSTSGFCGITMDGGTGGDRIRVRRRGKLVTTIVAVDIGDEGTAVEFETTAVADNNPATGILKTGASNLPCGKIERVINATTEKCALLIEGDGLR